MRIDVKSIVNQKKENIRNSLTSSLLPKKLLILQVGNNAASNKYVNGKLKDCEEVGYKATLVKFNNFVGVSEIINYLDYFGKFYDGIILQEPANVCGNKDLILEKISAKQDIDGFKKISNHKPCTPLGIVNLLTEIRGTDDLSGKIVTVVGRGDLVGKPLIPLLIEKNATVICCHSKTSNLAEMTKQADIVVTATGHPRLITKEMLKENAIVIDAGIFVDEDGKLMGDCDKNLYDDENILITTVPGGVGLMTRVTLLENLKET